MTVLYGATSFEEFVEEAQAGLELGIQLLGVFVSELGDLELDRAKSAAMGFATIINQD